MIPTPALAAWRSRKPWRDDAQVAQDLLLSALAIEIARHPAIAQALVWRGGTCLHQLHLPRPARYSEDLDYVLLAGAASYADLDGALEEIAGILGATLRGRPTHDPERYKALILGTAAGVPDFDVKIEVNSADAPPALGLITPVLTVDVPAWYVGEAPILTYQAAELIATKFRALSQRRKGRDLWDLDLARRQLGIPDDELADAAVHYLRHEGISPAEFRLRLAAHVTVDEFLTDLGPLVVGGVGGYDAVAVARRVTVWSDQHLDPRSPTHGQRASRVAPVGARCPAYTIRGGGASRCERRVAVGEHCPDHDELGPIEAW